MTAVPNLHSTPMRKIPLRTASSLLLLVAAACAQPIPVTETTPAAASTADSAGFVTRLGIDTLAIENFIRTDNRIEANVVLRSPSTRHTRYVMEWQPNGTMTRLEAAEIPLVPGAVIRREVVTRIGDSLRIEVTDTGATRTRVVPAPPTTFPFIDMVHWPYELIARRAAVIGADSVMQPLLTGRATADFKVTRIGRDSMTIAHPFRGTMRARVDNAGRLLGLNAGGTTVQRTAWMPLEPVRARWAQLDAAGRGIGALSGRGSGASTIGNAMVKVDYGTPAKRGREIWGALVPYGKVWRTGANLATHFETDRELVLGSGSDTLVVPPGKYTLFTIPEQNGGTLIVNRQTGQGGTTYDQARDLGRVRMIPRSLAEPVELFTILVTPTGSTGELRLQWDRTELVTPIRSR